MYTLMDRESGNVIGHWPTEAEAREFADKLLAQDDDWEIALAWMGSDPADNRLIQTWP